MSQPTDDVHWATSGSVAEPSSGRKDSGWVIDEKPPAEWFNWMMRGYGRWVDYLAHAVRSLRLTSWVSSPSGTGDALSAAAFLNNKFLIAGDTDLVHSDDGFNWTAVDALVAGSTAIGYGNGLYLVGGALGGLSTSPDLVTWTTRTSGFGATEAIGSILYGASIYVISGAAGKISTSPTGVTWTARTSQFGTDAIKRMVFANSLFVAAGLSGKISTSSDGITWTARTSQFGTDIINDLIFANGVFVAVGVNGKISTSSDGITWTARTSQFGSSTINSVVWNGLYFIAVGGDGKSSRSLDALTWTALPALPGVAPAFQRVVASSDGLLVANIISSTDIAISPNADAFYRVSVAVPGLIASGQGIFFAGGSAGAVKSTAVIV